MATSSPHKEGFTQLEYNHELKKRNDVKYVHCTRKEKRNATARSLMILTQAKLGSHKTGQPIPLFSTDDRVNYKYAKCSQNAKKLI